MPATIPTIQMGHQTQNKKILTNMKCLRRRSSMQSSQWVWIAQSSPRSAGHVLQIRLVDDTPVSIPSTLGKSTRGAVFLV